MKKNRNKGFTLSEALITLSIVGILAVIILPGLIKDSMNRAMVSSLKGVITNLNDAINTELVNKRALTLKDTDFYKDPNKFLRTLDAIKIVSNNSLFASSYKTISGNSSNTAAMDASATLKNGATLGIIKNNTGNSQIYIDTNGQKGPNIFGLDCFVVTIVTQNDTAKGDHAGDIGCTTAESSSISSCKSDGTTCYCALERSGFDYKYLELTDIY